MIRTFSALPFRAVSRAVAALFLAFLAAPSLALAQEEPAPVEEPIPVDEAAPAAEEPAADAATVEPASAEAAPAEAAPADPAAPEGAATAATEPVGTIPVDAPPAEANDQQLDTIEVTGSRIKRTDFETAQPVVVVTREDIERTGLTNIGDILQRLPAAGSALNRTFNNGGAGTTEIDLRNLGSNRVLVLVNGQRWVNGTSFANTSAVDLNTIPVSIIERVEVLKDGASAIYGSDAIAGVVNIITRKDVTGAEIGGQFQAFDDGKGLIQNYHASFGTVTGKTSMFVDVNVVRQNELFAGDRAQSAIPKINTGNTRGSIHLPKGYLLFIPNPENEAILAPLGLCPDILVGATISGETGTPVPLPPQTPGVRLCQMQLTGSSQTITPATTTAQVATNYKYVPLIPAGSEDYYNYAPTNYLLTPYGQTSLFTQISHQLLDSLTFQSQIFYGSSRTERQLADTPVLYGDLTFPPFSQVYIDATNIYNPFDQDIGRHPGFGTGASDPGIGPGYGIVTKRFTEYGPRFLSRDVKTLFLKGGFDGSFDAAERVFSYDAGYSYANSKLTSVETGNINMERLKLGLGPAVNCPSINHPDCVPVDFFSGEGSITPAMIDYLFYNAAAEATQERQDIVANISTELPELSGKLAYDLIPAPVGVAFGVTYRTENFREQPDPFAEQGIGSGNLRKRTEGGFYAREAYLELALPILAEKRFADELDLSLAARYTEYNTFDPETTYKLGLRWKPVEDLLLRATASTAFRAPAVTELFLGATDSYPSQTDPCAGGREPGTNVDEHCTAEGVPTTALQPSSQILNRFLGNTDLQPEVADTFTYGLVYSPSQVPDLNIYVDYFDIKIEDFIGFLSGDFILESCYGRPSGSPRPDTCDFVERNADGSISFIRVAPYNFPTFGTKGVDVAFDYILPVGDWLPAMADRGRFKLALDSQYLQKWYQCVETVGGGEDCTYYQGLDVGDQPLPRFKSNMTLEWALEQWTASWTTRFIRGTTEPCYDGFNPSLADLGLCSDPDPNRTADIDASTNRYDDIFYHNVQGTYAFPGLESSIGLGILNLFDQDPPASYSAFSNSAPATLYETWGSRQLYLKLETRF
jgi:iron complex outermembrane receptor protein